MTKDHVTTNGILPLICYFVTGFVARNLVVLYLKNGEPSMNYYAISEFKSMLILNFPLLSKKTVNEMCSGEVNHAKGF